MSQALAAGTGPRATRSVRLLWLGVRVVARAVRWAWQPGTDAGAENRRSLRGIYASIGALVGIASLLTAGAVRASGWRRVPWAAAALLVWLFTARTVPFVAFATIVARMVQRLPDERR